MIQHPDVHSTVMPKFAENIFTVLAGVPMVVVFIIALVLCVRKRDPLLMYCFIGGGLASLFEPVADLLSCLYFPAIGQNTAFETFGRPIPWALVFAYPWYVGGQGYLTYKAFEKGISAGRIWTLWLLFCLSDVLIESPGVLMGFHVYYGNQPFNFWGFPLWMAAVQSLMPLIAGALLYAMRTRIRSGWKLLAAIPFIPMADGMANAGLALPVWTTLGSDMSLTANYVGGTLSIAMSAVAVWLLATIFGHARPAAQTDFDNATARPPQAARATLN